MKDKNVNNLLARGTRVVSVALAALLLMSCGNTKNKQEDKYPENPKKQEEPGNMHMAGITGGAKTVGEGIFGGLLAAMIAGAYIQEQRKSKQR